MITCCHNCESRKIGCHADCEIYIKAREEHLARKEKELRDRHFESQLRYIRLKTLKAIARNANRD